MAVTISFYGQLPLNALKGLITDLSDADTSVKVALLTEDYTFDQDTHENWADITNEVVGSGYTAGGVALTNKTVTYADRITTFNADNPEWANSTITARYAVIYDNEPAADADKKLLCLIDFGENRTTAGTTFRITFDATKVFYHTVPV